MNKTQSLLSLAAPLFASASLVAAELNTPFESLPAETVAAFRFDNSSETVQRYIDQTRIGKLLLSDEKIAEYKAFVEKVIESEDEEGNFLQKLGEIGLELDDLYEMISSEFGAAVVSQPVPGRNPMPTLLVWAEMGDGVAERAFRAVLESSAENEAIERTDLDLPGGPGSRIRTKADGSSFLVSQLGNRFFFAIGQVMEPVESVEAAKIFEEAELNALGQFMADQQGAGGGFLTEFYSEAGPRAARPSYQARLEVLGDLQKLLPYLPQQNQKALQGMGADELTKIAVWSGLVDREERSLLFLGAPSPRSGIAKLFENEYFEFQPPAWVPSSVNTYTAGSFDMLKLYDFVVEIAKKFAPPEQVEQQIAMGNDQLQTMLQTDIAGLLSAFGKRIHMVEYPIEIVAVDAPDGTSVELPRSSQAVVMDFTRPEILQAGLAIVSGMAQSPNSGLKIVEEQGFNGIRVSQPAQGDITIAHGLGKLVIAIGAESTSSRIFSALANPPQGSAALANDPELRAFLSESAPRPGTLFSFSRGEKVLQNLLPVLQTLAKSARAQSGDQTGDLLEEAIGLFPTSEELEGLLGIGFSRMYHNEGGVILEGSNEYK